MTIPDYYKCFYKKFVRYAILMTFVALIAGFIYQESAKHLGHDAPLQPGVHIESLIHLALVHGHIFLIGVLIPLALVFMLNLGIQLGNPPVSEKTLKVGGWHYVIGATVSIGLMLYKGLHFLSLAKTGADLATIDQTYFGGMVPLRAAVYALTHLAMAVGLIWICAAIWGTYDKDEKAA